MAREKELEIHGEGMRGVHVEGEDVSQMADLGSGLYESPLEKTLSMSSKRPIFLHAIKTIHHK